MENLLLICKNSTGVEEKEEIGERKGGGGSVGERQGMLTSS